MKSHSFPAIKQNAIIHGYNLMVDAITKTGLNKKLQKWDINGACNGLTFAYVYFAHQGLRREYIFFLAMLASIKTEAQCNQLLQRIVGLRFFEVQAQHNTWLIDTNKIFFLLEVIHQCQTNQSLIEIGVLWNKTYSFICHQSELEIHLKKLPWRENESTLVDLGRHIFCIEKSAEGFYLFEPNNINKNALFSLIQSETHLAEVIINNAREFITFNDNVAFMMQLVSYAGVDKSTPIFEEAILEMSNDLNDYPKIKYLCDDYGKRKISRLDAALAIQKIDTGEAAKSGKLDSFLDKIDNYIKSEQDFVNLCMAYKTECINETAYAFQSSLLYLAARVNQINLVVDLLKNTQIDVNKTLDDGSTPLSIASQEGHTIIVELLLQNNSIDVNKTLNDGSTPLYLASQNGHTDIVELLLQNNRIDVNKTNENVTPLYIASQNGHTDIAELLLQNNRIDVNKAKENVTPLYIASQQGNTAIVKLLISHGALIDHAINASTAVLLRQADKIGRKATLEKLLRMKNNGAIPQFISNFTPLHAAILFAHEEIVKILIEAKADINAVTGGLSCMEIAKCMGNEKIISLMENALSATELLSANKAIKL